MMPNWEHLKKAGHSCVGCGREGDKIPLTKLATYALAYACWDCWKKYWNCDTCKDFPHPNGRVCKTCGCKEYRHQLAAEFDRQYANGVGAVQRLRECNGYGQNLGKCGTVIFANGAGEISRLCAACEKRWIQEAQEGQRAAAKLIDVAPDRILH